MKRFISWLGRLFTGWFNVLTKKKSEEAERRYKICMECTNKARIANNTYMCLSCGCILSAKCASPKEVCDLNKW